MASWGVLGLQEQDSTNLLLAVADPFPGSAQCMVLTPNLFLFSFTCDSFVSLFTSESCSAWYS